jgi:hypothetical protein
MRDLARRCVPSWRYVAPHSAKIHTLITFGIRNRTKPLVLKARKHGPCGFDSHRPLHFWLSGVSLRCPRALVGLSPSSHSLDSAATVPLIECVDRPSVGLVLHGLFAVYAKWRRASHSEHDESSEERCC